MCSGTLLGRHQGTIDNFFVNHFGDARYYFWNVNMREDDVFVKPGIEDDNVGP